MSKAATKKEINSYLNLYSKEQLELILKIIEVYSASSVSKSHILPLIMTKEEMRKTDTAIPYDLGIAVKELMPSFNAFNFIFNYNEPNTQGVIMNIFEELHIKMHTVLNNSNFDKTKSL